MMSVPCTTLLTQSSVFSDFETLNGISDPEKNYAREYYREVILSYRLIFAEVKSSHSMYKSPNDHDDSSFQANHDPLLDILCGQSWDKETSMELWDEIDAQEPALRYSTTASFRFLGDRLSVIQKAVEDHEPDGIWPLWLDKRDASKWWTFWVRNPTPNNSHS